MAKNLTHLSSTLRMSHESATTSPTYLQSRPGTAVEDLAPNRKLHRRADTYAPPTPHSVPSAPAAASCSCYGVCEPAYGEGYSGVGFCGRLSVAGTRKGGCAMSWSALTVSCSCLTCATVGRMSVVRVMSVV